MASAPDRSEEIDRSILKRYEVYNKLGKGVRSHFSRRTVLHEDITPQRLMYISLQAYGVVWRARDRKSGDTVALKKIYDAFQNQTDAQVGAQIKFSPRIVALCHISTKKCYA